MLTTKRRRIIINRGYALGGKQPHDTRGPIIVGKPLAGQTICFDHQTAQHICHCQSANQIVVGVRTRIPSKGHAGAWKAFLKHLAPLAKARGIELHFVNVRK